MNAMHSGDQQRAVFFVSDRTGLTAESYGRSLLAQFPDIRFKTRKVSFIDSPERAQILAGELASQIRRDGRRPIIFSTLVETESQQLIEASGACVIDLFNAFIEPLEAELNQESAHTLGNSQDIFGNKGYQKRLDSIDYALAHDDGIRPDQYDAADVVLVGVSRCGKTPTSLFLAMHFSIKAGNYPLTDDEPYREVLPECLQAWRDKVIGLTIKPEVLSAIREKRRSTDRYASLSVCRREVWAAESLFQATGIPCFDATNTSIEEIAGSIIRTIHRRE